MRKIILFFIIILQPFILIHAQTSTQSITGTVMEEGTVFPVVQASVQLRRAKDTTFVKGTTTDQKGIFVIKNVAPDSYILTITYLGFDTCYKNILLKSTDHVPFDLHKLYLKESSFKLSEVQVLGKAPEVVVKEDTLEYNPVAFKLQETAVVEDLLKRLPGVDVQPDGKINVGDKRVRRIFVDGKEFFGKDPTVATKNLPVEMIDKLQVVEKKSDWAILTGIDDGEDETIINITTKKKINNTWLGTATLGGGSLIESKNANSPRYVANGFLNHLQNEDQLSVLFNANNINNQGFTGGSNTAQTNMRGSSDDSRGINTSQSAGVNLVKKLNDQFKTSGNFLFSHNENNERQNSFRQTNLTDSVFYGKNYSSSLDKGSNLSMNYRIEFKPDTNTTVIFNPNVSYNKSKSFDRGGSSKMAGDIDSSKVTESEYDRYFNSDGLNVDGRLDFTRRMSKKGRRLSMSLSAGLNLSDGDGMNLSHTNFFLRPDKNQSLNQYSENTSRSLNYQANVSYLEPIRTNRFLQLSYVFRYKEMANIKETYDFDSIRASYSSLNPEFSKSLDNDFITQTIGLSFRSVDPKLSYTAGVNIDPSFTRSKSYIKGGNADGTDSVLYKPAGRFTVNISPKFNLNYRFSKSRSLKIDYQGRMRQPSVQQLEPTENNTNPLYIRSGNPDLLPSLVNTFSTRFNLNKRKSQQSLLVACNFEFVINDIINKTTYQNTGVQYSKPVNANGAWNTSGQLMFSTPLGEKKRFQITTNTHSSFNNRIGYNIVKMETQKNESRTFNVSENLSVSYRQSWLYSLLRGNVRYQEIKNTLPGIKNKASYTYRGTYEMQIYLPHTWVVSSDIRYSLNTGLSNGYNQDEWMWNAEISRQLFKNKRGSISLKWNDILRQKLDVVRNVGSNYIEDVEYNTLTGYVMISFAYRFNKFSTTLK